MPNNKSAAKRLRSDAKRTRLNNGRKRRIRTAEKEFLALVDQKDTENARSALTKCYSALDKAAKANTIHANKANRKKARLSAKLKALS